MKRVISIFATLLLVTCCCTSCYTRIDAGHEGIKVNLYGDSKGVDDVELVTGAVWFNPITTAVYEYPTFVQTVDYAPFDINAKDGSKFTVDPTININLVSGTAAATFKKYRKPMDEVVHEVLKTHIVNAYRVKLNSYTTDELVSKREEFEASVEDYLRDVLLKENFELGEMTSGLKYPESLERSITAKNEAVQNALRIENEVAAIEAEAKKRVAEAKGRADAKKIEADAEAYYNRTVSASLTTTLVNIKALEKWDGKTPVVSGGSNTFIDASKFVK
jgi:regulator of protease activity HflC (stomatin/prohibitin superfamily)